MEEGLLYQPLPEAAVSNDEAGAGDKSMAPLCRVKASGQVRGETGERQGGLEGNGCASYIHWWSGGLRWLKKHVAAPVWHALKSAAIQVYHNLRRGDAVCYSDGCTRAATTAYDGFECFAEAVHDGSFGSECESFSSDLSEYF